MTSLRPGLRPILDWMTANHSRYDQRRLSHLTAMEPTATSSCHRREFCSNLTEKTSWRSSLIFDCMARERIF